MKAKMQSFLMTLFFACLCLNSNAQYHHFIESGKTWRELVEYSIGMWYIDEYQIYGDTTINSVSYKKIEMVTSTDGSITLPQYSGAIREDTLAKRVYIYFPNDTTERLLYDFDLDVGEQHTFDYCYSILLGAAPGTFTVDSIGVYTDQNGLDRKVWYLNYSHLGVVTRIVEGIGSNSGMFSYSCAFDVWSDLVCVHKDSTALFVNDLPFANYCTPFISVGLEENNLYDEDFSLYPNPSNSIVNIDFENTTELSKVKVLAIDPLGRVIPLQSVIKYNRMIVDVSALKNGFYLLSIQTEETNYVKRILKE
ncbi:MAG: T9SS type A sorting domain-containing protein [Crocinitomicaceae bacterium]|nr:T9SS type A sorting domain-containing protein [Crocinitomicaceae bacterium]